MGGKDPSTLIALASDLCLQQEASWQRGERVPVERYLEQHTELASCSEALLDLVYNEIVLRQEQGEDIAPQEYYDRFPALVLELRDLWEIHLALDSINQSELIFPDARSAPTIDFNATDGTPPRQVAAAPQAKSLPAEALQGQRLGDYELLEILGKGGMGVVYRARQASLDRIVAVKMIRSGELASPREIHRFFAEARAVAKLHHPNIVAIHDVGEVNGQHFFSMDCIEGPTLDSLIREHPLSAERAAGLMLKIAEAIEYAHQQGILHRDLKPSNILLDACGQPQVTDFGLAKRVDVQATLEDGAAIVGTPSYMPPEQIDSRFGEVGPESDVYSLGAMLYELVVGRPPFLAANPLDTMMQVMQGEPLPPRVVNASLHRDIDTICMKCLEKEPRRRYATARQLAEDLWRFLEGEPLLARPVSRVWKVWRACKKKPGLSAAVVLVAVLLLVIVIANSWNAAKQKTLRAVAEQQRALAERQLRVSTAQRLAIEARTALPESPPRALLLACEALQVSARQHEPCVPVAEQVLRDLLFQAGGPPLCGFRGRAQVVKFSPDSRWIAATGDSDNDLRLWDCQDDPTRAPPQLLRGHQQQISAVGFSADGVWLVTADWGGTTCLWRLGRRVGSPLTLPKCPTAVYTLAVSPDSRWLMTAGNDRLARLWKLDRTAAPRAPQVLSGHDDRITSLAIRCDSRWAATAGADGVVCLWDLRGESAAVSPRILKGLESGSLEVRFSPDGRWLLATSRPDLTLAASNSVMHLWDLGALPGAPKDLAIAGHQSPICLADISPDSRWLATVGVDGNARLWDLRARDVAASSILLPKQDSGVVMAAFSPDSRWLMLLGDYTHSGTGVPRVRLWKLAAEGSDWRPVPLAAHTQTVWQAAFDPRNRWLVTCSADHTAVLWDLRSAEPGDNAVRLLGHEDSVDQLAVSPDGRWLVTGSTDDTLRLWNLDSPKAGSAAATLRAAGSAIRSITLSPDGRWLLACDAEAGYLWDLTARVRPRLARRLDDHRAPISAAIFSRDGRRLVIGDENGKVTVWNPADSGAPVVLGAVAPPVNDLGTSPDQRWLAAAGEDHLLRLWSLAGTARAARVLRGHRDSAMSVDFSQKGNWLASGGQDRSVRLWKLDEGGGPENCTILDEHATGVFLVRFSVGDRWLISASLDGAVHLADLSKTGSPSPPIVLSEQDKHVGALCASADGRSLAGTDDEGTVYLWNLAAANPRQAVKKFYGQPASHATLGISPDSRWIAVGSESGLIHLWDLDNPDAEPALLRGYGAAISMIAFTADSRRIVASGHDGSVRLWNLYLEDLLGEAAHLASRNLTSSEWRKTFPNLPYQRTFENLPVHAADTDP